jgi:hypothetical protein
MSTKRRVRVAAEKSPASQVVRLRGGAPEAALGPGAHFARLVRKAAEGCYEATLMTGEPVDVGLAPGVDAALADQCLLAGELVLVGSVGEGVVIFGALRTKASSSEEVSIEAPKTLVLRAGRAKLTLSADGKVKLSGSDVTIDAPREVRLTSARVEIP